MLDFLRRQHQRFFVNSRHARRNRWIVFGVIVILSFVLGIVIDQSVGWSWLGFVAADAQEMAQEASELIIIREAPNSKTLWDLLELIIVPASLLLIGFVLSQRQDRRADRQAQHREKIDREIAQDQAEETAMQNYFDAIADLLPQIKKNDQEGGKEARELVRIRTLTLLPRLNGQRKGYVLLFLNELKLIGTKDQEPLIDIAGSNLQGLDLTEDNLPETSFAYVCLKDAYLRRAKLSGAKLSHANLAGSKLLGAELAGADLTGADLRGAILLRTDLSGANLKGVKLDKSLLHNVDLTAVDLSQATVAQTNLVELDQDDQAVVPLLLRHADLSDALLRSVNLAGSQLEGASLTQISYDERTKWPDDFAPPAE